MLNRSKENGMTHRRAMPFVVFISTLDTGDNDENDAIYANLQKRLMYDDKIDFKVIKKPSLPFRFDLILPLFSFCLLFHHSHSLFFCNLFFLVFTRLLIFSPHSQHAAHMYGGSGRDV